MVPEESSGMALVEGTLNVPYRLDCGADDSVISQWMIDYFHNGRGLDYNI